MFYSILNKLCEEKNIKITNLIAKLGMGSGNLSKWKNGGIPKGDTLIKFAQYFGVTTDYLLGLSEQKENYILIKGEEKNMSESNKMFKIFANNFYSKEHLCKAIHYVETCVKKVLESKTFTSDVANKKIAGILKVWNGHSEVWKHAESFEEEFFNNRLLIIEKILSGYSKLIEYIPVDLNSFVTRELLQMPADDKKNIDDIKKEIKDLIQEWDYHNLETIETEDSFEEDIVE